MLKRSLVYIVAAALALVLAGGGLRALQAFPPQDNAYALEAAFLPRPAAVEFVSFGYRSALANLLWFNTIDYFGRHYGGDHDFRWLFHMCDLVTTLNPKARHVYNFGATMLSWEGNSPEQAIQLLDKAIEHFPDDWQFYYLRGFTAMFFLRDPERSRADFITASHLPGVHPLVIRLAAKEVGHAGGLDEAAEFLRSMIEVQTDPAARQALLQRLEEIERPQAQGGVQ